MIPRADIANIVQPIAAVDAPTAIIAVADAKQEAFSRLAQIAVGQQLQAKVLSTYNDGSYLVRIANTAARMVLPTATRTGDNLILTMVAKDPRPTFQLLDTSPAEEEQDSTSVSLSAAGRSMEKDLQSLSAAMPRSANAIIGRDMQLPQSAPKTPPPAATGQPAPESTKTTLSDVGKLVDALLHASEESHLPSAIKPNAPLTANPTNSTQLAAALHDSVTFSGVFYEAHVAAWAEGKRPLAMLQREPQAQLQQIQQQQQQALTQLGQPAPPNPTDLLNSNDPLHTQMGQIVNLQLNALEQQRVVWHGEVWPGQLMDWEIKQDDSDRQQHAQDEAQQPTWHSLMRLNFDHLGSVSASIRLVGQQIHVQLRTDNDIATAKLRGHAPQLQEAMQAAGSPLETFTVKRDAET